MGKLDDFLYSVFGICSHEYEHVDTHKILKRVSEERKTKNCIGLIYVSRCKKCGTVTHHRVTA